MSSESPCPESAPKPRRVRSLALRRRRRCCRPRRFGIADRASSKQEVAEWTDEQAIPTVRLVRPQRGPAAGSWFCQAMSSAFYTGSLFARASGYVTAWYKDIGAQVKKGDVLAVIATPDLDQQLAQAKGAARAAAGRGRAGAGERRTRPRHRLRTSRLVAQGWSSAQQGDTDRLTPPRSRPRSMSPRPMWRPSKPREPACRSCQLRTDQGALRRRRDRAQRRYRRSRQRRRHFGKALFQVADIHEMRVYVNVPQAFLGELKPGLKATLELPGRRRPSRRPSSRPRTRSRRIRAPLWSSCRPQIPTANYGPALSPKFISIFPPIRHLAHSGRAP